MLVTSEYFKRENVTEFYISNKLVAAIKGDVILPASHLELIKHAYEAGKAARSEEILTLLGGRK